MTSRSGQGPLAQPPPLPASKDPRTTFLARRDIEAVWDRLHKMIAPAIEQAEVARGEAKITLDEVQEALKLVEDTLILAVQEKGGKNVEERRALLSLAKTESTEYIRTRKQVQEAELQLVIRTAAYNRLLHEFAALRTVAEVYSSQNRVMAPGGGR